MYTSRLFYLVLYVCLISVPVTAVPNVAEFISQNVPTAQIGSTTYQVEITMKNSGEATWTCTSGHMLGSYDMIWGTNRQHIICPTQVRAMETYTFRFEITSPNNPETYPFQWQMLHSTDGWFSLPTPKLNIIVPLTFKTIQNDRLVQTEAETYITMSGVYAMSTSDGGWSMQMQKNDYMTYPIYIDTSGSYMMSFRVSPYEGGLIRVLMDYTQVFEIQMTSNNDPQGWETVQHNLYMTQGFAILTIVGGNDEQWSLNWYSFAPNLCSSNPCQHGGICIMEQTERKCSCPDNYVGDLCQDYDACTPNPCLNGGLCNSRPRTVSYTCMCSVYYTGHRCEQRSNACVPNPCQHGGTCSNVGSNDYRCQCVGNYIGKDCESRDSCNPNPCQNLGTCSNVGSDDYRCQCVGNYIGKDCESRDSCNPNPCQNGGTCYLDGTNTKCNCPAGYLGVHCEITGSCDPNPCQNGGNCILEADKYRCECLAGYFGNRCEHDNTNACMPSPCLNGGVCSFLGGSFYCTCKVGYTGQRCESADPCNPNPCRNGGTCIVRGIFFACSCLVGYSGDNCEIGGADPSNSLLLAFIASGAGVLTLSGVAICLWKRSKIRRASLSHRNRMQAANIPYNININQSYGNSRNSSSGGDDRTRTMRSFVNSRDSSNADPTCSHRNSRVAQPPPVPINRLSTPCVGCYVDAHMFDNNVQNQYASNNQYVEDYQYDSQQYPRGSYY